MALDLFRVSGGFQIDESSQILEGAVAPTLDAPVGSLYTLTTDGTLYTKIAAGTGADKWSALADAEAMAAAVAAEASAREAADLVLTNNLATEVTNRIAGDATNAAAITTEASVREAADTVLQSNITTEETARIAGDAALSDRIDALGNAFNYVGVLVGGANVGSATDLTALPVDGKNPGDYYKVTTAGYFNDGTTTFYKNVGDGLVWNLYGEMDSIDNTNSQVQGTTNEISVTGTTDTGYIVAIDAAFSGRITTLETDLAAEVTARTTADTALQTAIDAEVTARQAADNNLLDAINAESTRAFDAEAALQTAIDAEVTARQAADTAEASARAAADTVLTNNLSTLNTFVQRDGKVTEAAAVSVLADTVDVPVSAVQWIVHVQDVIDTTKVSAYEVFAASNGVTVDFTRFGLLKLNSGVAGVVVTATLNGAYGIDLSVTTAGSANIKIKRVAVV